MNKILLLLIVVFVAGCKEKFDSPAPKVATGYLVIEGVVDGDGGQTNIRLSRTAGLKDTSKLMEQGAVVLLEDSAGNSYPLYENGIGMYSGNLNLNTSTGYRLKINTQNSETYQSDFVRPRYNPLIDNIQWERDENGVKLFVDTHDDNNNTRYYQWEFKETWEFHSAFSASLKWDPPSGPNGSTLVTVAYRDASDPEISICWQSEASSNILLGSSAKLTQDVIHLPFTEVVTGSQKMSVLYSVLVRQYAWSREGYQFLERMKKNTESVGSVFDAQPSELNGNIHCISNPSLPAIGFFNISRPTEKRIFIKNAELPNWNYNAGCVAVEVVNNPDSIQMNARGTLPMYPTLMTPFGEIAKFKVAAPHCVDCTLTGTNIKPDYWP
ncbi:MAG: hypothetical protein JWR61_2389 [Ferruginibacter sp.]|uniref:DUF4249 domain-containing protein n=1 Tax=Ferruginibacter sp. TaxID=1940288 RepID=UPI0026595A7A|nr:DUF4249 domain-containing protein [Ferruginibacter sp.]MDB5277434.1 hypothetical protein [Ferruginibacter sp.]